MKAINCKTEAFVRRRQRYCIASSGKRVRTNFVIILGVKLCPVDETVNETANPAGFFSKLSFLLKDSCAPAMNYEHCSKKLTISVQTTNI